MLDKISPIKERILLFLENQGIKKTDFCERTGISYSNMKGAGLYSEIGGYQIGKILAAYPNMSAEWLIMGYGNMLKSETAATQSQFEDSAPNELCKRLIDLLIKKDEQIDRLLLLLEEGRQTCNDRNHYV